MRLNLRSRPAGWLQALAGIAGILLAGCGEVHHELRPPAQVSETTTDPLAALPPLPPPVPAGMQPFDRDWLYCLYPDNYAVSDEFRDPASHSFAVGFGLKPAPTPSATPNITPAPADPKTPAVSTPLPSPPDPSAAPGVAAAQASPPETTPQPKPRTTARIIVLPGFPGDGFDANINAGSSLGLSPVGVYQKIFHAIQFVDTAATPVRPLPPGLSQLWKINAVDDHGRYHGFIARSRNGGAWSFGICYPAANSERLRDTFLLHLTPRLGQEQRFTDAVSAWRIDTVVPLGWRSPGPSKTSRRWNAPGADSRAFFVITYGDSAAVGAFPQCTGDDALLRLRQWPDLRQQTDPPTRLESVFLPSLWAPCGQAELQLPTLPRAITIGAWLFYDPIARKKFCVYYGYQTTAEKAVIDGMLAQLTRVPDEPEPPVAPGLDPSKAPRP